MKAFILAAGLGTRLLPYTQFTPKPLFTIGGKPILDLIIEKLAQAGCRAVILNTHHLHGQVESYVAGRTYPVDVRTRYEPQLLGTGGGIRNIADFWGDDTLLVFNADVFCDIDLEMVMRCHAAGRAAVTMVMHDYERFNAVVVDDAGWIRSFDPREPLPAGARRLAFTGIHVLEPRVRNYLPSEGFAGIIDAYSRMLCNGDRIKACVVSGHDWKDIGTPDDYRAVVYKVMVPQAFETAFGAAAPVAPTCLPLHGDGSDRRWFRLSDGNNTMLMVDHGIRQGPGQLEADAYVDIGRHLRKVAGQALPGIFLHDTFAGLVFVEDLGDTHLQQSAVRLSGTPRIALYRKVIDQWLIMALHGARGFDTAWTWQSAQYDRDVILEKECRYFCSAFVANYLGETDPYPELAGEFERLVEWIENNAVTGFMHRDLQSRNIMLQGDRIGFIDFQGGRFGPLQYDLASLLIDPYVGLSMNEQDALRAYAASAIAKIGIQEPARFHSGYAACALSRNLQILGAFAFLSRVKGKTSFAQYIPPALESLRRCLDPAAADQPAFPRLKAMVEEICNRQDIGCLQKNESPIERQKTGE